MALNPLKSYCLILPYVRPWIPHKRPEGYQPDELQSTKKKEKPNPKIFLNNHSQIANLPRKIHVPEHLLLANKAIQMSEIKSLADMAKVTVQIKVVNVEHPTEIRTQLGKELPKWDCLVADSSACWSINEKHTLKHCTFKSPWKVCYEYLWVCTFVERLQRSSSLTLLSF